MIVFAFWFDKRSFLVGTKEIVWFPSHNKGVAAVLFINLLKEVCFEERSSRIMKMASSSQVLSHRNPTHANDSFSRLCKLRREGILCDLTILVQGQKFKVNICFHNVLKVSLRLKNRLGHVITVLCNFV